MVNIEQIQLGINNYVDSEIISKGIPSQKFLYGVFKGSVISKIPKIVNKYKDKLIMLDIMNNDNMVDIDNLYKLSKESIKNSGQFTFMGLIFGESDIDKLYEYIKQTNVQ